MTPLYMRPHDHAAVACERAAARVDTPSQPRTADDVRRVLRAMAWHGGVVQIAAPGPEVQAILRAMLLEGLVCCDHSSGVWRVTDLGRAGVGP